MGVLTPITSHPNTPNPHPQPPAARGPQTPCAHPGDPKQIQEKLVHVYQHSQAVVRIGLLPEDRRERQDARKG